MVHRLRGFSTCSRVRLLFNRQCAQYSVVIKPTTMQLVIAASPLRTQQVEADIDWLRRKILQ